MSDIAIEVEDLSKLYRLGQVGTGTLSHDLNKWWHKIRGKDDPYLKVGQINDRTQSADSEYVLALQDINFKIHQGDVVGIIGRNGAGKSTLLKILSKITAPSKGKIKINGRIASLLEVGTGFHPELTGKENIFMNGAILGMRKKEIQQQLDAIVDFAGVERYLNTPVKRYSSGMYVRLAFAVAAFLEPDILIVDEVLAVGDAEFQKKCLGRMKDVSQNFGRTVLFVSHNMAAVKTLCKSGIVLKNGTMAFEGTQLEAVNYYQSSHETNTYYEHDGPMETAPGNDNIRILKFEVTPLNGGDVISISTGVEFALEFYNNKANINLDVTFELVSMDEVVVFHNGPILTKDKDSKRGIYRVSGKLEGNLLNAGSYRFNLIFGESQRFALFYIRDIIQFEVLNETIGSNSLIFPGVIRPSIPYTVTEKQMMP